VAELVVFERCAKPGVGWEKVVVCGGVCVFFFEMI